MYVWILFYNIIIPLFIISIYCVIDAMFIINICALKNLAIKWFDWVHKDSSQLG